MIEADEIAFQNSGVLRGVIQKINPFKSTSEVTAALSVRLWDGLNWPGELSLFLLTQVHKAAASDSLEQGRVSEPVQV